MPGVIGVPCGEQGRWSAFWGSLCDLERPAGTRVLPGRGSSVAANRNLIASLALDMGAEWVFWLDDDLTFRPDTLLRLLRHDVPVVVGLSVQRHRGFEPLWLHRNTNTPDAFYTSPPPSLRADGLVPIAACTSGGMLTRRAALEAVGGPHWWTLGQFGPPDQWCDDLDFCRQLTEAGVPIYGDPSVRLGHLASVELWPHQLDDGRWTTILRDRTGDIIAHRPMAAREAVA